MGRAQGINAVMTAVPEVTYGTTPGAGFFKLPMVSSALGEEQPLIEDDQLGFGREGLDPTYDVITNTGDVVVPVDQRGIGFWLRQTFGPPVTSGPVGGKYTHTFTSGASSLPSASIEIGNPDLPTYSVNYGSAVNQLKIGLARSGMLNASLSMIAQGEADPTTVTVSGSPTLLSGPRFAQATGNITQDGAVMALVTAADLAYSNNIETLEVIRQDGRIGGIDPGKAAAMGSITVRFADLVLFNKSRAKTPVALTFGWANGTNSLTFTVSRVFLPKPKRSITGPKGVLVTYNWQASGATGPQMTVVLVNDVTSYT